MLTPEGNGEFCGIGLMNILWKAVLVVANFRIGAVVDFHDTLNGFRAGRVTRTTSLKSNLLQQPTVIR